LPFGLNFPRGKKERQNLGRTAGKGNGSNASVHESKAEGGVNGHRPGAKKVETPATGQKGDKRQLKREKKERTLNHEDERVDKGHPASKKENTTTTSPDKKQKTGG